MDEGDGSHRLVWKIPFGVPVDHASGSQGDAVRADERMKHEDYSSAVAELDALVSRTSARGVEEGKWTRSFEALEECAEALRLPERYKEMRVVHVAGTKGKGSVCAMVESVLRKTGKRTGLYTSPHLMEVRERIRINGSVVSEEKFARLFWTCWHRLKDAAPEGGLPALFRFLTLMAMYSFVEDELDVAILETGLGGRLDATNIVPCPIVCGISPIGFDHMELLGDTLGAIAREKAGIFKPHVPAFTALQEDEAMQQLKKRAEEIGAPLQVARTLDEYSLESGSGRNAAELRLGLDGVHQRSNAALAVALCHAWEKKCGMSGTSRRRCEMLSQGILPKEYEEGLTHVEWPGRAQIIAESPNVTYFLDGAHTSESMNACASWFVESSNRLCDRARTGDTYERWMLFYCKKDRNPERLLSPLSHHLRNSHMDLTRALFVVPDSSVTTLTPAQCPDPQSSWERHLQLTWEKLRAGLPTPPPLQTNWPVMDASNTCHSAVVPSVAMAMKWIRDYPKHQPSKRLHVLVTGSLYLVGDALRVLRNGRLF